MSVVLHGNKPLWDDFGKYLEFIREHIDEIHDRYLEGDEIADLIVVAIDKSSGDWRNSRGRFMAVIQVAVERYINLYHRDIATIRGGSADQQKVN